MSVTAFAQAVDAISPQRPWPSSSSRGQSTPLLDAGRRIVECRAVQAATDRHSPGERARARDLSRRIFREMRQSALDCRRRGNEEEGRSIAEILYYIKPESPELAELLISLDDRTTDHVEKESQDLARYARHFLTHAATRTTPAEHHRRAFVHSLGGTPFTIRHSMWPNLIRPDSPYSILVGDSTADLLALDSRNPYNLTVVIPGLRFWNLSTSWMFDLKALVDEHFLPRHALVGGTATFLVDLMIGFSDVTTIICSSSREQVDALKRRAAQAVNSTSAVPQYSVALLPEFPPVNFGSTERPTVNGTVPGNDFVRDQILEFRQHVRSLAYETNQREPHSQVRWSAQDFLSPEHFIHAQEIHLPLDGSGTARVSFSGHSVATPS